MCRLQKKHPVGISKIMESFTISALTGSRYFDHHRLQRNVAERLASASLYLVTARVDWPAGGDVCAACLPYQSPHHRLQDTIENRDICVHYQPLSP